MMKKHPAFDDTLCTSCGICAQACPVSCLCMTRPGKQGKYRNVFPELTGTDCTGCGLCAKSCPMEAVRMESPEAEDA